MVIIVDETGVPQWVHFEDEQDLSGEQREGVKGLYAGYKLTQISQQAKRDSKPRLPAVRKEAQG